MSQRHSLSYMHSLTQVNWGTWVWWDGLSSWPQSDLEVTSILINGSLFFYFAVVYGRLPPTNETVVVALGSSLSFVFPWEELNLCEKDDPSPGSCDPDEVEVSDQYGCTLRFSTASSKARQITKDDFVDGNCTSGVGSRSSNWTAWARVELGKTDNKQIILEVAAAELADRSVWVLPLKSLKGHCWNNLFHLSGEWRVALRKDGKNISSSAAVSVVQGKALIRVLFQDHSTLYVCYSTSLAHICWREGRAQVWKQGGVLRVGSRGGEVRGDLLQGCQGSTKHNLPLDDRFGGLHLVD